MRSYSDYWLTCDHCKEEWIGEPYRKDGSTERCPECDSDEFEVGAQYGSKISSLYPLILLIPNFLIFWS